MRSGTRIRGSRAALVAVVGVITFLAVPGTASAHGRARMAWVQLNPSPSPSPRVYAAMAFDAAHGQDVLVGIGGRHDRVDTWTWDGTAWTKHHLRSNPPVRSASIAYDAAHGDVVLFGGSFLNETESNETWIWDGTTWTQVTPPVSPPARSGAGMAYDPTLGEVVLFGGVIIGGDAFRDTWAWDGTTWTELHPATSPDRRGGAAMAYDRYSSSVILVDGYRAGVGDKAYRDTWRWDGSTWTQLHPLHQPGTREWAAMADAPSLRHLVLFGGTSKHGSATWLWDGADWMRSALSPAPGFRAGPAMAADPTGGALLFGGVGVSGRRVLGDTWRLGPA